MITDERLAAAAAKSCEIYVEHLTRGYDPNFEHKFSPAFERKMKRLQRRADHPVIYRSLKRVAVVFLALLLGTGIWLSIDAEARAVLQKWISYLHEDGYFVMHFRAEKDSRVERADYELTWIPDGYTEYDVYRSEGETRIIYIDESDRFLMLLYADKPKSANWFIFVEDFLQKEATVNGCKAEIFISNDPNNSSVIMWTTPDNVAFMIDAFLSEEDLIKIAESVRQTKK